MQHAVLFQVALLQRRHREGGADQFVVRCGAGQQACRLQLAPRLRQRRQSGELGGAVGAVRAGEGALRLRGAGRAKIAEADPRTRRARAAGNPAQAHEIGRRGIVRHHHAPDQEGGRRQVCRIGWPGQQHAERHRQQRTVGHHGQRTSPLQRSGHAAERGVIQCPRGVGVERGQTVAGRFQTGAQALHQGGNAGATRHRRHRDTPVAEQESPAAGVGERDAGIGFARCQQRQHRARRHHLLHELAVLGRGGLQRRIGIGHGGARAVDAGIQIGGGGGGGASTGARQVVQLRGTVLQAADRRRHGGIAGVLGQPRRRLLDLLAGHAAAGELRQFEHRRQSVLGVGSGCGLGVQRQAGLQQHRVHPLAQPAQDRGRRLAGRQGVRPPAVVDQGRGPAQLGLRQRARARIGPHEILGGTIELEQRIAAPPADGGDDASGAIDIGKDARLQQPVGQGVVLGRLDGHGGGGIIAGGTQRPGPVAPGFQHPQQGAAGEWVGVAFQSRQRVLGGRQAGHLEGAAWRARVGPRGQAVRHQRAVQTLGVVEQRQRLARVVLVDQVHGTVLQQTCRRGRIGLKLGDPAGAGKIGVGFGKAALIRELQGKRHGRRGGGRRVRSLRFLHQRQRRGPGLPGGLRVAFPIGQLGLVGQRLVLPHIARRESPGRQPLRQQGIGPGGQHRPGAAAAGQHADGALDHGQRGQHAVGEPDGRTDGDHQGHMRPAAVTPRALQQRRRRVAQDGGGGRRTAGVADVEFRAPGALARQRQRCAGGRRAHPRAGLGPGAAINVGPTAFLRLLGAGLADGVAADRHRCGGLVRRRGQVRRGRRRGARGEQKGEPKRAHQ